MKTTDDLDSSIKAMWQDLNQRISHLENENKLLIQKMKKNNYKTAQTKLIKKYWCFIAVEIIMIIYMTLFFLYNPQVVETYRFVSLIYWDVFFVIAVIFDSYLLIRIKQINVYTSTIKEVSATAAKNWQLHKIGIVAGLPMAFGAAFVFGLAVDANRFTIYGMIVGGLIGLAIGLKQLSRFKNYYDLLQTNE
ncbi:MAG: hypothetical protein J1F20_03035 [Muribaculaceae bacterium]|nr:hypothetical protein [Muribaculaceae bacterium]